jgi:hypothetical protein
MLCRFRNTVDQHELELTERLDIEGEMVVLLDEIVDFQTTRDWGSRMEASSFGSASDEDMRHSLVWLVGGGWE